MADPRLLAESLQARARLADQLAIQQLALGLPDDVRSPGSDPSGGPVRSVEPGWLSGPWPADLLPGPLELPGQLVDRVVVPVSLREALR